MLFIMCTNHNDIKLLSVMYHFSLCFCFIVASKAYSFVYFLVFLLGCLLNIYIEYVFLSWPIKIIFKNQQNLTLKVINVVCFISQSKNDSLWCKRLQDNIILKLHLLSSPEKFNLKIVKPVFVIPKVYCFLIEKDYVIENYILEKTQGSIKSCYTW